MATYYANLDLSGLGGIGSPSDPKGSAYIYVAPNGTTLKAIGSVTLSGDAYPNLTIEPWISGVPWRINANNKYMYGTYSFFGGIIKTPLHIYIIEEASGCAFIDIKRAGSAWITNPGNLTNCLLNFTTGGWNASSAATVGDVRNCLIVEPSGGYGAFWMLNNTTATNSINNVTNAPTFTGIFKEAPLTQISGTTGAPFTSGSIPTWSTTTDLQNFCLGYYASGIGPVNFASGYWVRFISEISGAVPFDVTFSGLTNIPSSGTVTWVYNTNAEILSGKISNYTYTDTGLYSVNLSSYWTFPSTFPSTYNTWIYETFSGGTINSYWNPDATGAFSVINGVSGYQGKFTPGNVAENMRMMTPWGGPYITGNFEVSATLIVTGVLSNTWPSIGIITVSGDMGLEGSHWSRQGYEVTHEVAEVHLAGLGHPSGDVRIDFGTFQTRLGVSPPLTYSGVNNTAGLKIIRSGGIISGYYKDGNGAWSGLAGSVNYSGPVALEINGCAWANFLNYYAQADYGLPYSVSGLYVVKTTAPPQSVYLSGYIWDTISNSGISPYWNTEFNSLPVVDMSGYFVQPTAYRQRLLPSGTSLISGEFDLQCDFVDDGTTQSLEIGLIDEYNSDFSEAALNGTALEIDNNPASHVNVTRTIGKRYTIRIIRGATLSPSGTITTQSISSGIHYYYFDNLSGSASNTWKEFNTSPYTTAPKASGKFYLIAERNTTGSGGFDNLYFQSNSLPGSYSSSAISSSVTESVSSGSAGFSSYSEVIVTYLPSTDITGFVEGEGYIYSEDAYEDFISGLIEGQDNILGIMTFIYAATDDPPASSGTIRSAIKPILTNKNRYPYKVPGDTIISKVDVLKNGKLSYLEGIPVELWMNYSGSWNKCEDAITDRYGSCYINHSTNSIPNITNCLGVVRIAYEDGYYVSNLMRYNFFKGVASDDLEYIIDAAPTGLALDRLNHDIFDGSGRLNYFDRMYYV
jgi:hypothetical protein